MNNVTSLNEKKTEKQNKENTKIVEDYGMWLDKQFQENADKLLLHSKKLLKFISNLSCDDGFDVHFKDIIDGEFVIGFRCLKITGSLIIMVGGYGSTFKTYYLDKHNLFNNFSGEESKYVFNNRSLDKKKYLHNKIMKEFLVEFSVKRILKIDKNYNVF